MQDGHGSAVGLDLLGDSSLLPQQLAWNTNGQRGNHSSMSDRDVSFSSDELPGHDYDDEDYAESRDHKRHKRHHDEQHAKPRFESAMTAKLRDRAAARSTSPSRGNSDEDSCHEDDSDQGNDLLLASVRLARSASCRSLQQTQRYLSTIFPFVSSRGIKIFSRSP